MKNKVNDSVSERSVCEVEDENLQSSSDSDSDDELFEDCLSRNSSPAKSSKSADGYPSSDDTFYSSHDIENIAEESNLLSISGDGTLTDHAMNKNPSNSLNAAALSPSHSRIDKATKPDQRSPSLGARRKTVIRNFPVEVQEYVGILNVRNLSSSYFETEIPDVSGYNDQLSSDSSDSGWITVKSSARAKSRSRTSPVIQASRRQTETPSPFPNQKTASQARMNTTKKTSKNMKTRGKVPHPKFTMRSPNTHNPPRNQLHDRPTELTLPSSATAMNPNVGIHGRVSYSEVAGYSVSGERSVMTVLNQTAGSSNHPSADALEVRSHVSTSLSSNVNDENRSGDDVQIDRSESNLNSRRCPNCSDSEASNSYLFSPAVGTPVRLLIHSCNLKEEAQKVSLPVLEEDDSFPHPFGFYFAGDSEQDLPCISLLLNSVENRIWAPRELQCTDESLVSNISSAPGRIDTSSNLRNSRGSDSNVTDSSKQGLFIEASNENSSTPERASLDKTISIKSSNASPTFRTEELILQPPSKVDKSYHSSGGENKPSNVLNKNELHTPDDFSSTTKAGLKSSLNTSVACKSPCSDNASPFFRQVNALESQSIIDTNTIKNSVGNENIESVLNKSRSPSSLQNKNTCVKSQGKNASSKVKTLNISPAKSISNNQFQRLDHDNSHKFTATPNEGDTMMASSEKNVSPRCTKGNVKSVHQTLNPSSSQSFSHCPPERPVSKNDFSQNTLEGPILRSAFIHTSSVRIPSDSASSHISVRPDFTGVFPGSLPLRTVSNSNFPQTSLFRPVFNRTFSDTSIHSTFRNATFPTSTDHSGVNSRVPKISINHAASNMLFHTSAAHLVSNSTDPHTSANSKISSSVTPVNSTNRSVSNSAVPHIFPRNPIASNPFPQTANHHLAASSGAFKINYPPKPPPQQPCAFQFPPPGNFHQAFAQSHNNLTRSPCASMRLPIPSSSAFPSRVFSYQSAYTQHEVFISPVYPSHSFVSQTNQPPVNQRTMHIPPLQKSSTNCPDKHLNTLRPPLCNPYGIIHTGPNRHAKDYFPEYLILKQRSGHGLRLLTLEINSGQIYYSVIDWQVSDSDPDDSSFTELSKSELSLLDRKDVFIHFQRLERRRNHIPSAENALKLTEKPDNHSSKEPKFRDVNLDRPNSKPSGTDQYPNEIQLDNPSGLGCTFLTLTTQSGQTYYSARSWQFTDSDSDTDDSPFTELSQSQINVLNRKDCNRYFRRLRNHVERCKKTSKPPDEPYNPSSAESPKSYVVNINGPGFKPMVKAAMNLKPQVLGEENKDVSFRGKQTRMRSKSEKQKLKHFTSQQQQAGRESRFRRSTSYPGLKSYRTKLPHIKE